MPLLKGNPKPFFTIRNNPVQSTTTRPYQFEGNLFVSDITQDLISNDFKGQLPQDFQLDEKAKLAD